MCLGALLAYCYFEELKIDCAIDQLKPGLKSEVNGAIFYLIFLFKGALVENALWAGPQHAFNLLFTHMAAHKHAKYKK